LSPLLPFSPSLHLPVWNSPFLHPPDDPDHQPARGEPLEKHQQLVPQPRDHHPLAPLHPPHARLGHRPRAHHLPEREPLLRCPTPSPGVIIFVAAIPDPSPNSPVVGPGARHVTVMPIPRSSSESASENEFTNALVA